MKTQIYHIRNSFARRQQIPQIFKGVILRETERAVYVYGHGTMETAKTGMCCVCGRTLTHPVSVTLGIGPECGGHWWDWKTIGGYTIENIERLKQEMLVRMEGMKVDTWMPRSIITQTDSSDETITVPQDHKMVQQKKQQEEIKREAILVKFKSTEEIGFRITFPFNREDLERVKTLEGRKYNPEHKYWNCPLTFENAEKLKEWNFEVDPRADEYTKSARVDITALTDDIVIPELGMELYPFQKKGIAFLEAKNGRALIADEMGLGKTAQALAWLQLHTELRPVVIIVPASLKLNWEREAQMWMNNPRITILQGTTGYKLPKNSEIIIINYDILANDTEIKIDAKGKEYKKDIPYTGWLNFLIDIEPQVVVADEVHYAKSNSAQRTKALKQLVKVVPHFIGLSGTPIVNRPVEFFNAIKMVDPNLFPSFWKYAHTYCDAKHNGYGWDFNGSTKADELHALLTSSIMIRRKKEEVLTELPDKVRTFLPIELSNRKDYNRAEANFIDWIREHKGAQAAERASNAQALAEIETLKQLSVHGKLDNAINWIQDFIEVDGKLVVFATHKNVIDRLMVEFPGVAVKVDGSVTGQNRQLAVDRFQNDPKVRLFIGNIQAAGVGITLTAASNVAFLELPWSPGACSQAEDRCHRIGQKDTVNIYYLLAQNTIEDKIAALLDSKRKVLDQVLDGKQTEETSLLTEIISSYEKN